MPFLPRPSGCLKRGGSAWSISDQTAETKAGVMTTTPKAKRHKGSTSDSACADDLDEAALGRSHSLAPARRHSRPPSRGWT